MEEHLYSEKFYQKDCLLAIIQFLSCCLGHGIRKITGKNNLIEYAVSSDKLNPNIGFIYKKKCYFYYSAENYNFFSYSDEYGHQMKCDNDTSNIKFMCKPLDNPI